MPLRCCLLVQLHQLNSGWSEARKASYVKHAVREYNIHKALRHINIVSLTDIFEVRPAAVASQWGDCHCIAAHVPLHMGLG